ncbi:unnamed protein product [Symbiodinium microadriaticum]|nr:unnamed protein product [Symbiodinium microadriaticum]
MSPRDARKNFVQALAAVGELGYKLWKVADKHGFEFSSQSHDWILQIRNKATGKQCSVFGYTFDVNPALTSAWLHHRVVAGDVGGSGPCIEALSLADLEFLFYERQGEGSNIPGAGKPRGQVQEAVNKYGFPVVVKPLKGTGGLDVIKATCWREVEAAVQHIFSREYGLAVSPYKRVIDEYRCVCLGQQAKGGFDN